MTHRLLHIIVLAAMALPSAAQQYVIVNDEPPILASDVINITYEADDQYERRPLPDVMAADAQVSLFSQALQLTGLADTLTVTTYAGYKAPEDLRLYYTNHHYPAWNEVAWYNEVRYKTFTVFAETDDVLAAQGISNIEQLKAYASQVYDAVFPEDAAVSDPTDRRNSLNRFVAYHILPHGTSYWYLTYYDGKLTNNFVDTDVTDISTWYSTLMPHASLKCSYPMAGDDSGLYLNHRGLKSGPDKYGKQVRGAKITACKDEGKDPFTRWADNGCYFYIDRPLTYDLTTRDDVLGSELWRVDFKTLLPDVMNNVEELRGDYLVLDDTNHPNDNMVSPVGRSFIYSFDCLENVEGDKSKACPGLIARRSDSQLPDGWQGDAMYVLGDFGSITLKLPPLPAGEWEVRLGSLQPRPVHPDVRVSLNGEVVIDKLELSREYYAALPYRWLSDEHKNLVRDLISKNLLQVTLREDGTYLLTDIKTGERIFCKTDPYRAFGMDYTDYEWKIVGYNEATGEEIDWTERATAYHEQAVREVFSTLPKMLLGPRECQSFRVTGGYVSTSPLSGPDDIFYTYGGVRYVLGRIQSDGKTDNYLRIETCGTPAENSLMALDYLELVPKSVCDNTDIPEE